MSFPSAPSVSYLCEPGLICQTSEAAILHPSNGADIDTRFSGFGEKQTTLVDEDGPSRHWGAARVLTHGATPGARRLSAVPPEMPWSACLPGHPRAVCSFFSQVPQLRASPSRPSASHRAPGKLSNESPRPSPAHSCPRRTALPSLAPKLDLPPSSAQAPLRVSPQFVAFDLGSLAIVVPITPRMSDLILRKALLSSC